MGRSRSLRRSNTLRSREQSILKSINIWNLGSACLSSKQSQTEFPPESTGSSANPTARAQEASPGWGKPLSVVSVGVLSILHFYGLWVGDLFPWDECSYAIRARAAMRGLWLDQMPYCYAPWWEEVSGFYSGAFPPFLIWLMAVSMSIFGATTFAVRLPTALLASGCIWVLYLWCREMRGRAAGVWAAFIFASLFFLTEYARRAQFDVPVTFFTLLTIYLGDLYYKRNEQKWLALAGVAMGIGLMTKILVAGFAAVALLLAALVLWVRREIRFRRIVIDQFILNAIGVGLALPWHIYMILKYRAPGGGLIRGDEFINYFWGYHVAQRMDTGIGPGTAPWYFYFTESWDRFLPLWTVLFGLALVWAVYRISVWTIRGVRERDVQKDDGAASPLWSEDRALLIPTAWLVFVLAMTMHSSHKYKSYLIMMAPSAVVLLALFLDRIRSHGLSRWSRYLFALVVFYLTIAYRSSDHFEILALRLSPPIEIGRALVEILPFLLGAVAVLLICEILARFVPRLRQLTIYMTFAAIVVFGFHSGLRKNFRHRYFRDNRWAYVSEVVKKGDLSRLVFYGMADQPDHFYYLDGINAGWRKDVEYLRIKPSEMKDTEPLPASPDTLVILEKQWISQMEWTQKELERILQSYTHRFENEHMYVYQSE